MSGFETAALSDSNTGGSAGGSAASASSPASGGITVVGVSSAAEQAPAPGVAVVGGDGGSGSTPLSAEETAAVFSEQPTGDVPSASEMEDRKDATSSSDNLLPTDKLQNGLKNVSGSQLICGRGVFRNRPTTLHRCTASKKMEH